MTQNLLDQNRESTSVTGVVKSTFPNQGPMTGMPLARDPAQLEVELTALSMRDDGAALMAQVPVLDIYTCLSQCDIEKAADLLPLISRDQWQGIVDLDGWRGDRLNFASFAKWLSIFQGISLKMGFERYKELDEEYQIAMLAPFIHLIDLESWEKLGSIEQDSFIAMPGNEIFYRINTTDKQISTCIEMLIAGGIETNMEYTLSLLSHSFFMPPNEQEMQILQFRTARLEELGFIPEDDAKELITPLSESDMNKLLKESGIHDLVDLNVFSPARGDTGSEILVLENDSGHRKPPFFLKAVLEQGVAQVPEDSEKVDDFIQRLQYICNGFSSARKIDPGDLPAIRWASFEVSGFINIALEILSNKDESKAFSILMTIPLKSLLRAGIHIVRKIQTRFIGNLSEFLGESGKKLKEYHALSQWSLLEDCIDLVFIEWKGIQVTETLKAAMQFYPANPQLLDAEKNKGEESAIKYKFVKFQSVLDLQMIMRNLNSIVLDCRLKQKLH